MKPLSQPCAASAGGEASDAAAPHPVDRQVGLRIRMRRKQLGFSQERLAEALGLTFQQVQKYERAANRVSASKLFEIARALDTSVTYFFDGLPSMEDAEAPVARNLAVHDLLLTPEGAELADLFAKLPRGRVRGRMLDLFRAMADAQPAPDPKAEPAPRLVWEPARSS
ncbi:helix-turn-helix transcriptional regulator [Phenylobacterium sp. LjRoot225]|uniref:helix-turn-helix domain-containing protein n=1 Tax=Phenylobacterium sp. LjRoot225 TaxID=3342285 RepID=UPI003ECE1D85